METVHIITIFLSILIFALYLLNRHSINSTKTELSNSLNVMNTSVLRFEGDLNTIKAGNILPGGNMLSRLTKNALETKNFVFLESELDKVFATNQDQEKIIFLGVHQTTTSNQEPKTKVVTINTFPLAIFVSKRGGSYTYFALHPYDVIYTGGSIGPQAPTTGPK